MSDVLRDTLKIDQKFFRLRTRVNKPKRRRLVWRDESRLSLRRENVPRVEQKSFLIPRGTVYQKYVCDQIARIAGSEVGTR